LDKCTIELDGIIETIRDIEEEACQRYCDVIYSDRCQFFVYDRKQKMCNLLSTSFEDYYPTCEAVGGPKAPSIQECNDNPCKVKS
jgi:hypothetical protein